MYVNYAENELMTANNERRFSDPLSGLVARQRFVLFYSFLQRILSRIHTHTQKELTHSAESKTTKCLVIFKSPTTILLSAMTADVKFQCFSHILIKSRFEQIFCSSFLLHSGRVEMGIASQLPIGASD